MKHFILVILLFISILSCSRHKRPERIFIDDVEQTKQQLEKLDTAEIFSYTEYDERKGTDHFDRRGDTVIIIVKTKKVETRLQQQRHKLLNRFLDSVDKGADILIVVNGILLSTDSQKQLRNLPSDSLSYVDTMEFYAAKQLYGSPARPTTLIINTYSLHYNYKP